MNTPQLTPVPLPPGEPRLIVRQVSPENMEYPMEHLNGWLTPNRYFFRRNHFDYPTVEAESWQLSVAGLVNHQLRLSLADLKALPQTSLWMTLECSGNKRGLMQPKPEGDPWTDGAIGNAEWGGVPLAYVLQAAGVKPEALEILFQGADRGIFKETGQRVHFARSLPVSAANDPALLLALTMNGEPLPMKHGAPVRLLVPEWYGMASVKWLTRIELIAAPFQGPFQTRDYVYIPEPGAYEKAVPVTLQKLNGTITYPRDGAQVPPGPLALRGAAWSGRERLAGLEVSLDGRRWWPARLAGPEAPSAWRLWEFVTPSLKEGVYQAFARAIGENGERQPFKASWNAKGYGNNQLPVVRFRVVR